MIYGVTSKVMAAIRSFSSRPARAWRRLVIGLCPLERIDPVLLVVELLRIALQQPALGLRVAQRLDVLRFAASSDRILSAESTFSGSLLPDGNC